MTKKPRLVFKLLPTDEPALAALRVHNPAIHAAFLAYESAETHSYEALAAALNMPMGSVKSRVHRGKVFVMKFRHIHGLPTDGQSTYEVPVPRSTDDFPLQMPVRLVPRGKP